MLLFLAPPTRTRCKAGPKLSGGGWPGTIAILLLFNRRKFMDKQRDPHLPPPRDQAEHDSTGRSAHEPGAKLDAGKQRPALVLGNFARALSAVADVGTYGAKKYTPNGWRTVPNGVERYSDAMMRHWLQEQQGELCDPETKLLHAAHLAWNALARLELMLSGADKERAVKAEAVVGTWRNDRLPTKEDAGPDGGVWMWRYSAGRAWKFRWRAVGSDVKLFSSYWADGNLAPPTQPPAHQDK